MKIPQLKCKRCGHKWYPRTPLKPKVCPKCKSPYWDRERKEKNEISKDPQDTNPLCSDKNKVRQAE
jgi:predicted Zn-ribbon and HTH transcriptional regulator